MEPVQVVNGKVLHFPLEGVLPSGHVLAVAYPLGLVAHLVCEEGRPCLLGASLFTPTELLVLDPVLESYPAYCPYEVLLARFAGGASEQAIAHARQQLYEAYEEGSGDLLLRPVRNVLSRVRLKLHGLGLDVVAMVETGYLLRAGKGRMSS